MKRRHLILVLGCSALGVLFLREPGDAPVKVMVEPEVAEKFTTSQAHNAHKPQQQPQKNTAAYNDISIESIRGFQDAQVRGRIEIGDDGLIRLNHSFKELLDYFLTMRGRFSEKQIRQQFELYVSQRLSGANLNKALETFDRYKTYLDDLRALIGDQDLNAENESIRRMIENRRSLRRDALGVDLAEEFFSREEAYEQFQLSVKELDDRDDLGPDEKKAMMDELEQSLPIGILKNRRETFQFAYLKSDIQNMNEEEAEEEVRHRYGDQAADRFKHLQNKRVLWGEKVQEYKQYRQVLIDSGYGEVDLKEFVDSYKKRHFSEAEQRRLSALELVW